MELATVSTIPSSAQSLVKPCGFSSLNLSLQKEKLCAVKGRNPTHRNEKTMANFDFTTQSDKTQLTQSHHNCVDTWAFRTAKAPQAGLFCLPHAYKLRSH